MQTQQLLGAALSNNTKNAYKRTWNLFIQHFPNITSLPLSPVLVCNFIACLFSLGYSPNSISSHVSAISYVHKILSLQDPSETFLVRKIIQGCHHSAPSKDSRLPITGPILANMLKSMDLSVKNLSTRTLLKSIFLLAFNAFLRIGEIVIKSKADQCKVIQRNDATFEIFQTTPVAVEIIKNLKTNKTHHIFQINLKASFNKEMCPVQALNNSLYTYGQKSGPLFQVMGGEPVTYL